MADSDRELESDTSSIDGGPVVKLVSPGQVEQLQKRIESLQQENRVLRMELDTYKLKCKNLQEENRELRRNSVTIVSMRFGAICQPMLHVLGLRFETNVSTARVQYFIRVTIIILLMGYISVN